MTCFMASPKEVVVLVNTISLFLKYWKDFKHNLPKVFRYMFASKNALTKGLKFLHIKRDCPSRTFVTGVQLLCFVLVIKQYQQVLPLTGVSIVAKNNAGITNVFGKDRNIVLQNFYILGELGICFAKLTAN